MEPSVKLLVAPASSTTDSALIGFVWQNEALRPTQAALDVTAEHGRHT